MTIHRIASIFFSPEESSPPTNNRQSGILRLVDTNGETKRVSCELWTASATHPKLASVAKEEHFFSPDHTQAIVIPDDVRQYLTSSGWGLPEALFSRVSTVAENMVSQRIAALRPRTVPEERGERIATLKTRITHLILGAIVTPQEILTGIVRIAIATARVARAALALGAVKLKHAIRKGDVKQIEIAEKRCGDLATFASRQVRIGLLQLIPIIGAQLANQYKQAGSLKNFLDSPAIGGLIKKVLLKKRLDIPQMVYGVTMRHSRHYDLVEKHNPTKRKETQAYWSKPAPTVEDARAELLSNPNQHKLVRIPVATHDGKTRYHDASLVISPANKGNEKAKTVVLYHGNASHHISDWSPYGEWYLTQGYNVLLCSYAGDLGIEGDGTTYKEVATPCSEHAMREDATADVRFLQGLGVEHAAVYGISLGGAQAMNFAQAAASSRLKIDFVTLNKTFTSAPAVCGRAIKKETNSRFLGRMVVSFARRFFSEEPQAGRGSQCDCLDNAAKLKEIHDAPAFRQTHFTIIGGTDDQIMGEPRHPWMNFAYELYNVVRDLGDRATIQMEEKGHFA